MKWKVTKMRRSGMWMARPFQVDQENLKLLRVFKTQPEALAYALGNGTLTQTKSLG